jgi:hypothetical protein
MKKIFENKRDLVIEICVVVGVIAVIAICLLFMKNTPVVEEGSTTTTTTKQSGSRDINKTETIGVIPTMYDTVLTDSAWTPTFELIWHDLKNKYVHQDITWAGQPSIVDSLNKEYFKENMISDEYLYKIADYKTLELKKTIEKGIKDKFNQESDVLDDIDWSDSELDHGPEEERRILLYSMLYREFEYINPLDELQNSNFKNVENVRYFGFDNNSDSKLTNQIEVLYYDTKDYMIKLNTKNGDELFFIINPEGSTFNEMWTNANNKANKYTGNKVFTTNDYLKIPYLSFDIKREYTELCNHIFFNKTGTEYFDIQKAIQTIKLELDNKGGKVKSEAVIDTKNGITSVGKEPEHRYFYYNDTFALFIKEKNKDVPYFAARVDDINKYQEEA